MDVKLFNGVTMGASVTITTAMASAGTVSIDFGSGTALPYPLVYSIIVLTSAGVFVPLVDAVVVPNDSRNGNLKISDGAATFAITATDTIMVQASYAREV